MAQALLLFILATSALPVNGELRRFYPISINEPATLILPSNGRRPEITIAVVQDPDPKRKCSWEHDCFTLSVRAKGPNVSQLKAAVLPFSSSYASFRLFVTDLTGDGIEEIAMITGQGRGSGPCAREEYLSVYRWEGSKLRLILDEHISACSDEGSYWSYDVRFMGDLSSPAVFIKLDLQVNQGKEDSTTTHGSLPKSRSVLYGWNPSKKMLEPKL